MALYQVSVTLNQVVTTEEINTAAKQLVANFVHPELDPLSRYALARALQSAAEICAKELAHYPSPYPQRTSGYQIRISNTLR